MRTRPRPESVHTNTATAENTVIPVEVKQEEAKLKTDVTTQVTRKELAAVKNPVTVNTEGTNISTTQNKRPNTDTRVNKLPTITPVAISAVTAPSRTMEDAKQYIQPYDLSQYKVIHIPESADGTNNCSGIARRNQQKILNGNTNTNYILFGDAQTKIALFQKLYTRSGKQPGTPIKVLESFGNNETRLTEFTRLHDNTNIINPNTGVTIEQLLRQSMANVDHSSPLVWEMFIDTAHKHRVTIVYGTDTYTPISRVATGKDAKGRTIYKKVYGKPIQYTGFRTIDTLRGPGMSGNGTLKHGKVPLQEYFNSSYRFYFRGEGRYTDLYLRTGAPIGFEPWGSDVNSVIKRR